MNKIKKRFPANTTLDKPTFLNNSKISAELYAFFLVLSVGENGETRVYKNKLPSTKIIAEEILRKSRSTYNNYINTLKKEGYLEDKGEYWVLPKVEEMYFTMELDLLQHFIYSIKEEVLKVYIYLGQRYNYKPGDYVFTIKEICEHLGLGYERNHKAISSHIDLLQNLGLITIVHFYEGNKPMMRLKGFSTTCPKK